jgi:hypothetical protein
MSSSEVAVVDLRATARTRRARNEGPHGRAAPLGRRVSLRRFSTARCLGASLVAFSAFVGSACTSREVTSPRESEALARVGSAAVSSCPLGPVIDSIRGISGSAIE